MNLLSSSEWLLSPGLLLLAAGGSAIAAALLAILVLKGGPVDTPRERGVHVRPTPTSGGMAIMAACALLCGLVLWFFGTSIPGQWRDGALLLGFAGLMGLSGAVDDVADLPARLKLAFQIGLCLGFAWIFHIDTLVFGPGMTVRLDPFTSTLGCAAWLVLGINTINFMDGSNGLAIGTQAIALTVLAALLLLLAPFVPLGDDLGIILLIFACAAGAHLGFLPFNLSGRAFQGDAGALFGGALITGGSLVVKAYGAGSVWFGGFLLAPLLVDVVLTLFTRLRHGKDVLRPHKEHLYQLWLQRRDPNHMRLALRIWVLCAISSGVGLVARAIDLYYRTDIRFACLAGVIVLYSLMWFRLRRELVQTQPLQRPGTVAVADAPEA